MPVNNTQRNYHLNNIKDWLRMTDRPLRAAQKATADALKVHCESDDAEAICTVTDIAQAINTALSYIEHAQDLTQNLLGETDIKRHNLNYR